LTTFLSWCSFLLVVAPGLQYCCTDAQATVLLLPLLLPMLLPLLLLLLVLLLLLLLLLVLLGSC
jgi:hypothetical protein